MKACDKCKGESFRIEFKVYGITFICALCGNEDMYYFEDYEG
jgi:hypothetical protein